MQIYPGNKKRHIETICEELNIRSFEDALFFDDDPENIYNTYNLGVIGHLIDKNHGLNMNSLMDGLQKYHNKLIN